MHRNFKLMFGSMVFMLAVGLLMNLSSVSSAKASIMTLQWDSPSAAYQGSVEGVSGDSASTYGSQILTQGPADGSQSVGLSRFDDYGSTGIGTIASSATVTSATLTLDLSTVYPNGTLYVAPITTAWTAVAGAGVVSPLPGIDTSSAVGVPIPSSAQAVSFDVTNIVQSWVDGSVANNGFAIYGSATNVGAKVRTSNSGYNYANAPLLTINYSTPEPASLALFGAGTVFLLARRRRSAV